MVFFAGCNVSTTTPNIVRDDDSLIQTDKDDYQFVPVGDHIGFSVGYIYTNTQSDTLYIANCNGAFGVALQRRNGNVWTTIWSPELPACLSSPIVIAPNKTLSGQINISGAKPGASNFPDFPAGDLDGVYRLVFFDVVKHYRMGDGFGDPVAEEFRVSNDFNVNDP